MAPNKPHHRATTVKSKTAGKKKIKTPTFLKSLPESVEHSEIVQQVALVLEELQKRMLDVRSEASKELKKILKRYEDNYKGLGKKVHQVTADAKTQAQTSMIQLLQKWHEHKEKLPSGVSQEIEKIIGQIGAKVMERNSRAKKPAPKSKAVKTSKPSKTTAGKKAAAPKASPKASSSPKRRIKATASSSKTISTDQN